MTANITKEQAIQLWFKFIESDFVKKESLGYGPILYNQFILRFIPSLKTGNVCSSITLLTKCIYENDIKSSTIDEKSLKTLVTPYGSFELDTNEAIVMRGAWESRDKQKGIISYEELINLL